MTKRYIIDKADVHDLLTGKALSLSQDNESAFCVTISGNPTNGDMIKAVFPNVEVYKNNRMINIHAYIGIVATITVSEDWWNAPYREGDTE